jgi:ATP-binding cassette subfamily F protein 1
MNKNNNSDNDSYINKKKSTFDIFSDSDSDSDSNNITSQANKKQLIKQVDNKQINNHKQVDNKQINNHKQEDINIINSKIDKLKNTQNVKKDRRVILNEKNLTTLYNEKLELLINGKKLINESDITINSDTKYFLIGKNGCGKTTLLKYLYEKIKDNNDILMIDQDIFIESDQTIKDFILDAKIELHNKYKRMLYFENKEELNDDESIEYNELSEYVYSNEWDKYEAESKKILDGLGFKNITNLVSILSGGWRMRLAIGKALLRKPNILFLDEPTNHLDLEAVIWLTDYLYNYKKTIVVITHQINMVNNLADYTWYIGNPNSKEPKLYTIRGGYNNYIKTIEQLKKEYNISYEKFQKRITELKKKSTSKKDIDEFIKKNNITRPEKTYEVKINFENVTELSSKNIIQIKNTSFSYNNNLVFNDIDLYVQQDSRFIIVGNNGTGKTTLFKLCMGLLNPDSGDIIKDDRMRISYYNQQILENLPLNKTSIEYLIELDHKLDENKCRGILGRIGLKKTDLNDPCKNLISSLSGGQKARVAFSAIQINNPHIILMDEPTNHLDIESIEGLIDGINNYNGAIMIITHDIYLIESINNSKIIQISNNKINHFKGDFNEYSNHILSI